MAWRLQWFENDEAAGKAGWPVGGIIRDSTGLFLITPVGLANIAKWEISGPDEKLTARPSILCRGEGTYHGYLTEGVLSDDVDGRKFPELLNTA